MAPKAARRAYSTEQLLALRQSASDEPVSTIENRAQEKVIKDHVLRGSRSFVDQSSNATRPLDMARARTDNPSHRAAVLGEIQPNNQTIRPPAQLRASPTPSLKKQRAEQVLKQHGSPPGLRVTAGGRIVSSNQSPLCSPRYGYSAINKNGGLIRFAPGYPPPPHTFSNFAKSLPNGFVAQDPDGKLCQMVEGRFVPINEVNGVPQLFITAPNLTSIPIDRAPPAYGSGPKDASVNRSETLPASQTNSITAPSVAVQISALEKQYKKLETERRGLDKAEVLQRGALTSKGYQQLIQKRRELVRVQDELRRNIKILQDTEQPVAPSYDQLRQQAALRLPQEGASIEMINMLPPMPFASWAMTGAVDLHGAPSQFWTPPQPAEIAMLMPPAYHDPQYMPPYGQMPRMTPMQMYPPQPQLGSDDHLRPLQHSGIKQESAGEASNDRVKKPTIVDPNVTTGTAGNPTNAPGHVSTHEADRSCPARKSALNPMSAVYQPNATSPPEQPSKHSAEDKLAEAVRAHNEWAGPCGEVVTTMDHEGESGSQQHSSECSFTTADFFPRPDMSAKTKPVAAMQTVSDDQATKQADASSITPAGPDFAVSRSTPAYWEQPHAPTTQTDDAATAQIIDPISDRTSINISPKTRRGEVAADSSADDEPRANRTPGVALPPNTKYEDVFKAALDLAPVDAGRTKSFLEGYCAGLQHVAYAIASKSLGEPSESDPVQRDNVSTSSSIAKRIERRSAHVPGPQTGLHLAPFETLRQAVFAPKNENALLSPASNDMDDGTTVEKSLGQWAKDHLRSLDKHNTGSVSTADKENQPTADAVDTSTTQSPSSDVDLSSNSKRFASTMKDYRADEADKRTFSALSQPPTATQMFSLQRAFPGHRVLSSPGLELKSSSITQVVGLVPGSFSQFDGTEADVASFKSLSPLTRGWTLTGAEGTNSSSPKLKSARPGEPKTPRFREESMPGMDPPGSPTNSPLSLSGKRVSPTRAKIAQIAGKAGIKVRGELFGGKESHEPEPSQMSPQERRRWRDMWKKKQLQQQPE